MCIRDSNGGGKGFRRTRRGKAAKCHHVVMLDNFCRFIGGHPVSYTHLGKALKEPARPMVAIVGGSKVSTKLTVLDSLSKIADQLIVGGGIANTFIAAQGHDVGKSLYEADLVDEEMCIRDRL